MNRSSFSGDRSVECQAAKDGPGKEVGTSEHREADMTPKYIFVSGGVVSSVGKGITVASIGRLLKARGISVCILKLDPYINVAPGPISPYQHGEVFVTDDGAETVLDHGHYEPFIDEILPHFSNVTT